MLYIWNMLSALHRCARDDNLQACRILLSYNVDPSIVSLQGYTAAQVATENVLKILQGKDTHIFLIW
jgi:tankyrase